MTTEPPELMTDLKVGGHYRLRDGHKRQHWRVSHRRVFRYEGRAPGPKPTGNFLDVDSQKMHSFLLTDVVPTTDPGKRKDRRASRKRTRK